MHLSNHYHLMIETPEPNLVEGMKWLQNAYTRRFNTRNRLWGRLFGDRYKAVVVEGERGEYYCTLLDYIHLNPVRAGLVQPHLDQSVLDYPWSSVACGYALPARRRAAWLAVEAGLRAFDWRDETAGRRRFVERLDRRAREEAAERCGVPEEPADLRLSHLRRGWYWGTQAFAEKLLKMAEGAIAGERIGRIGVERSVRRTGRGERRRLCGKGWRRPGLRRPSWRGCAAMMSGKWRWRERCGRRRPYRWDGSRNGWKCAARPT